MNREAILSSNSPLYLQLRELIRSKIESGEYPPGVAIPPVNDLARFYGIHRLSVRSAISALLGEGMLKSIQGKGIFVVGERIVRNIESVGGFSQDVSGSSDKPVYSIYAKSERSAGAVYGAILNCPEDEQIYYIRQVLHRGGAPISLEEVFMPVSLFPTLKDVDLRVFSIYEALAFYGIHIARGDQVLEITRLDPMDARLLNADPARGVFQLGCVSSAADGTIVLYTRTYTRGDHCTFGVAYKV